MAKKIKKSNPELERLRLENQVLRDQIAGRKRKRVKKNVSDERALLAEFVILLNQGKTREEIFSELAIGGPTFESLFSRYFDEAEQEIQSKTPLRVFSEYVGRQTELVRDLQGLKKTLKSLKYKNAQAYVMAVRTQSEILDKLIKTGQDLGLVVKTPDQVLLVGGKDARELDSDELELEVMREMENIRGIIAKKGTSRLSNANNVVAFPSLEAQQQRGES